MTRSTLEPPTPGGVSLTLLLAILSTGAALLFAFLWSKALERSIVERPGERWVPTADGFEHRSAKDDRLIGEYQDPDRDGLWDRIITFGEQRRDGRGYRWRTISSDPDRFGVFRRFVTERADDLKATWTTSPKSGLMDTCEVTDARGNVVQVLEWRPNVGFVIRKP